MARRFDAMLACLAGSGVASLVGLLGLLRLDAPVLAAFSAGVCPAIACWLTGAIDRRQVAKIAGYAAMGWTLTFMLQPAIAQSSASHAARILALPLLGHDWHVAASTMSTLLALIGVYFAPLRTESTTDNHFGEKPESPDANSS